MKKHFLSICAIIKDEGRYLREWIEWHRLEGVEHFYLYDNESTDSESSWILKSYFLKGIITVVPWPGRSTAENSMQLAAYRDCFTNYGEESTWIACIDADEFLWSRYDTVKTSIKQWPESVEHGAIVGRWLLFGSNGEIEYRPDLVTKRFPKCENKADKHFKTIVKSSNFVSTTNNVHQMNVRGVTLKRVEAGPVTSFIGYEELSPGVQTDTNILVLHYHTKSREEYRERCARGRADCDQIRDFETNFPVHDKNEVEGPVTKERIAELERILKGDIC